MTTPTGVHVGNVRLQRHGRDESYSRVTMPHELASALREQGYIGFEVYLRDDGILLKPYKDETLALPNWNGGGKA